LVDRLILNNVEFEFVGEGSKATGSVRLIYNVMYHEFRPGSIDEQQDVTELGEFDTAQADWFVGHDDSPPDTVIEATDTLTLPD